LKIGLVGSSSQERSLPFDAQRMVNLYPVIDQQGKEVTALYGTPGLSLFTTAGTGVIRNMLLASNGRAFAVSGATLFEIDSAGTTTSRGSLLQSSGNITMADNGFQLAICDGVNVYMLTYATNAFAQIISASIPSSGTITFIDGYFVVNQNNSGQFNISGLFDGLTWGALDFATAESSPDNLLRVETVGGQLALIGDDTTELWTNTGNSDFPFSRVSNVSIDKGILAPHSSVQISNNLFWLGKNLHGDGIVYVAAGLSATRISTSAIEKIIQDATDKVNMKAFTYQEDGHLFYVLTGGGLNTSLVYDITTKNWHERAFLNEFGNYEQHLANSHMFVFNKHLVGDRKSGNIYEMNLDLYDDNGSAILRERIYTHLSEEQKRRSYHELVIGFETGVGLTTGQGSDPLVRLQLSKDGARTWSDSWTASIGKKGEYKTKVSFRRLGIAEEMTFRIKISEPVKIAITGSYLK